MRRILGWMAVLGLVGTLAGCYKGRGVCDCLDYRDPCCYGAHCYGCGDGCGDSGVSDGHGYGPIYGPGVMTPPPPVLKGEPLKTMPKEIEKVPPPLQDKN